MDEEIVGSSNGPKLEDEFEFVSSGPVEVDNRPLSDRIGDKSWRTRQTAYEDLRRDIKATLGDDPLFAEFSLWLVKMTSDAHPGALDAGLDTALVFVDLDPSVSVKPSAEKICGNIVDKVFGARPATQAKGKALILKMMEVDETGPLTAVLLSKLVDKKPKVIHCMIFMRKLHVLSHLLLIYICKLHWNLEGTACVSRDSSRRCVTLWREGIPCERPHLFSRSTSKWQQRARSRACPQPDRRAH